ncbi:MAG: CvpA family protein [Muribaculaceae bacterium]|nr:CvpA family protein [Muribaculaceae bacterium]
MDAVYHLLVIIAGLYGLFRGWRLGLTGQIASLLGVGFGAVCACVFAPQTEEWIRDLFPGLISRPGGDWVCCYVGGAATFAAVYTLFGLLGGVCRIVMEGYGKGTLDSAAGCLFCAFRYLLWIGVIYDLLFSLSPSQTLRHCVMSDDGNVVQGVMYMAPPLTGCEDLDEYLHLLELDRARSISMTSSPPVLSPPYSPLLPDQPSALRQCYTYSPPAIPVQGLPGQAPNHDKTNA